VWSSQRATVIILQSKYLKSEDVVWNCEDAVWNCEDVVWNCDNVVWYDWNKPEMIFIYKYI